MKTHIKTMQTFYALAAGIVLLSSCKKSEDLTTDSNDTSTTIAVAATNTSTVTTAATDSVYLLQPCGHGQHRDSIAAASLPATITDYLTANYSGYTFSKAFAIQTQSATVAGYVVVIYYNDKPVGLQFDSAGNFVKVLEQRERGDLNGAGFHRGGRFEHRDGQQRDTVALTALPATITNYFAANYSTDTLLKAFKARDSFYVVISKNTTPFATVFDASGNFIKRIQITAKVGNCVSIEQSALPATALTYLTTTFPNYVFEKAFAIRQNATVVGYVVFIDANNTKYAVEFTANGSFVRTKTVH